LSAKPSGNLPGWLDQHNMGAPAYEHIERIIVERASPVDPLLPSPIAYNELANEAKREFEEEHAVGSTNNPGRHWSS
jgi:hypothetical protein